MKRIPGLQKLTAQEKAALAYELLTETGYYEDQLPVHKQQAQMLNTRWKHYLDHPETASTWQHVKDRLRG